MTNFPDYKDLVNLDQPFVFHPMDFLPKVSAVEKAVSWLTSGAFDPNASYATKRKLLQSLLTTRSPDQILSADIYHAIDSLLQAELNEKQIVVSAKLPTISNAFPRSPYSAAHLTALWKGDITTLKVDAIVNAANSKMLGCFQPFHKCIDNAIHAAAGPRLRDDCYQIMKWQGHDEKTGSAKLTRAYNLPSRFVIHTVGPIVANKTPQSTDHDQLSECYRSCLDLAKGNPLIRSVAFCSISTGVFGYPIEEASKVALKTVSDWLLENSDELDLIVFNVFGDHDENIYKSLLEN